ncbi:MAG: transcriptional regulator [Acidobacteria bacterium]|nr:transcriptional regulator [Acidobacteriota bacterium]
MGQPSRFYDFGPFRLDATERVLLQEGEPLPLTPKAFDTLMVLVQRARHIVEKDDLIKLVWPDAIVEENNLTQNISLLRKALGESSSEPKYIETIPRRGYRFIAPVNEAFGEPVELIVAAHTRSQVVIQEESEIEDRG